MANARAAVRTTSMSGTFARIASKAAAVARSDFERRTADSSSASGDALGSVICRADAGVLRKTFARDRPEFGFHPWADASPEHNGQIRVAHWAGTCNGDAFRILAEDRRGRAGGEARATRPPLRFHPRKSGWIGERARRDPRRRRGVARQSVRPPG